MFYGLCLSSYIPLCVCVCVWTRLSGNAESLLVFLLSFHLVPPASPVSPLSLNIPLNRIFRPSRIIIRFTYPFSSVCPLIRSFSLPSFAFPSSSHFLFVTSALSVLLSFVLSWKSIVTMRNTVRTQVTRRLKLPTGWGSRVGLTSSYLRHSQLLPSHLWANYTWRHSLTWGMLTGEESSTEG